MRTNVGREGLEPPYCKVQYDNLLMQTRFTVSRRYLPMCTPAWDQTRDLLYVRQALSQLSYRDIVRLVGLEPTRLTALVPKTNLASFTAQPHCVDNLGIEPSVKLHRFILIGCTFRQDMDLITYPLALQVAILENLSSMFVGPTGYDPVTF